MLFIVTASTVKTSGVVTSTRLLTPTHIKTMQSTNSTRQEVQICFAGPHIYIGWPSLKVFSTTWRRKTNWTACNRFTADDETADKPMCVRKPLYTRPPSTISISLFGHMIWLKDLTCRNCWFKLAHQAREATAVACEIVPEVLLYPRTGQECADALPMRWCRCIRL